jgi:hypothetical protein
MMWANMSDVDREIETTKVIVRDILKTDQRARNEDLYLIYLVFRKFTNIFIKFSDFRKLPSAETITRIRRELNAKNLFLADDPKVLERRQRREREFKEYYGRSKAE